MDHEKTERKIKELNAIRAMKKKYLKEIEEKHQNKEISEKKYINQKQKMESKIEKIIHKIRDLEESLQ